MEFLNLIMNGFAYILSAIEKKVEINLLMKSSSAVSLGYGDCWRMREKEGRREWKLPSFEIYPLPSQLIPELF